MSSKIIKNILNEISNAVKKQYGEKDSYPLYAPKFYKDTSKYLKKQ